MKASELSFTYLAFSQRADSLAHSLRSRRGPGENGEFFFLRLLHFPRAISRKERHSHEAGHGTPASSPCSSSSSSRFGYTTEVALGSESSEDPPPGLCSQVDLHWMGETNICSSGPVAPPPARSLAPSLSPNANGNKQQQKTATASAAAPRSASPATPSERSSRSPLRKSSWRSSKGAGAAGSRRTTRRDTTTCRLRWRRSTRRAAAAAAAAGKKGKDEDGQIAERAAAAAAGSPRTRR